MLAFLNETSLQESIHAGVLQWLHELVTELSEAHLGCTFLLRRLFFESPEFKAAFNHIAFPNPLIRAAIRKMIFSPQFFADWHAIRVSETFEIYTCQELGDMFSDDSQCEAAERGMRGHQNCFLLNTAGTRWAGFHEMTFERSDGAVHHLRAITDRKSADMFLASCDGYYPDIATYPPRDCQTILLKSPERFQRTNKTERNGKRQVFRELDSGFYYYVDNLHFGLAAHLEVFDSDEQHLGEADIDTAQIAPDTKCSRSIKW